MDVYLDTAATSRKKPECVYEAMDHFMREVGASPGRSQHGPGIEASRVIANAREGVARLLGVDDSARIVFTANCTEALNLAIQGILKRDGHVVTTSMEHNSVMRPLRALESELGIHVTQAKANSDGTTEPDELSKCIRPETALIVMTHASNVAGAIQPIEECGEIARRRGIPFLVDAAQTAGCLPIDLAELPVDMLAFSGHKGLLGPQGVGGLYVREGIDLEPLKYGGTGSRSAEEIQPVFMPDRFESGTPNTPGIAGLGAAVAFLAAETVAKVREHVVRLGEMLLVGLGELDHVRVYGPKGMARNAGVFSFTVDGRDSGEVAEELEAKHGILIRVGLQCAPSAHRAIGTFPRGTIRASIGCYTTEKEVKRLLGAVDSII